EDGGVDVHVSALPQPVHGRQTDTSTSLGRGLGGHARVAVHGDTTVEVHGTVQRPVGTGVPGIHVPEDLVGTCGGGGDAVDTVGTLVGVPGTGGGVEDAGRLAVGDHHQQLGLQVDLHSVALGDRGLGHRAGFERGASVRADDTVPSDPGRLLQGGDRVHGVESVLTVDAVDPVTEFGQAFLKDGHLGATVALAQVLGHAGLCRTGGGHDRRGDGGGAQDEGGRRRQGGGRGA